MTQIWEHETKLGERSLCGYKREKGGTVVFCLFVYQFGKDTSASAWTDTAGQGLSGGSSGRRQHCATQECQGTLSVLCPPGADTDLVAQDLVQERVDLDVEQHSLNWKDQDHWSFVFSWNKTAVTQYTVKLSDLIRHVSHAHCCFVVVNWLVLSVDNCMKSCDPRGWRFWRGSLPVRVPTCLWYPKLGGKGKLVLHQVALAIAIL